jgi:ribose-phosphate pyrophosphokinase
MFVRKLMRGIVFFTLKRTGWALLHIYMRGIVVFAGSSHPEFANALATRLGLPLGNLELNKFANLEIGVEIRQSVRDMDVYIIQTSYDHVNDYLMELLILVHSCKISSAARGRPNGMD